MLAEIAELRSGNLGGLPRPSLSWAASLHNLSAQLSDEEFNKTLDASIQSIFDASNS